MDRTRSADDRLSEVEALTDSSLGRLDVDEMLRVLLDRISGILNCDTAAVLLLDNTGRYLVARAARGVEEEVRQGVRVPIGSGFAGRVAAELRPVALDRVDQTTVTNPILWEKGIRAMLGVPLRSGNQVLGVLHVGSFNGRPFTADDANLMEMVAERVAGAVKQSLDASERAAAGVLQRSLLPSALQEVPGLRLASRYVPSQVGGVGGDWYDAFVLPNGDFWVVIGDVGGHGLQAAVTMGRLRSALRAYALEAWAPEEVLRHADRKLQHFESGATATVLCAVFSPPYVGCRVASAGHPPAVLAAPGRPAHLVDVAPAPLLGAVENLQPSTTVLDLPPDGVLLLYTDGLVERRDQALDAGIERLRSAVWPDDPEVLCRRVMDSMVGSWIPEDDIAVVAVQRR
jgi:putative methionine-R-sulfoxide reductase with GAF domain